MYQKLKIPHEINIISKALDPLVKNNMSSYNLCMLVIKSSIKFYDQHTSHTSITYINFKIYANASKHMNMHKSNAINQVYELAPPTSVFLLSKNFDPPLFFNIAPS